MRPLLCTPLLSHAVHRAAEQKASTSGPSAISISIDLYERLSEFRRGLGPERCRPCPGERDDRPRSAVVNLVHFSAPTMQRLEGPRPTELLAAEAQHDVCAIRHWQQFDVEMRLIELSDDQCPVITLIAGIHEYLSEAPKVAWRSRTAPIRSPICLAGSDLRELHSESGASLQSLQCRFEHLLSQLEHDSLFGACLVTIRH